LFAFGVLLFGWEWTGFVSYTTPKSDTEEIHPGKTFWDFLDLLIVPAALAVFAYLFRRIEQNRDAKRDEREQQLEEDRQREAALQTYLDRMTELLRNELGKPEPDERIKAIARTLMIVTMRRLDGKRNETLLRFLDEAGLIGKDEPVIHFQEADLSRIDLRRAYVPKIDFSKANLEGANLEGAWLMGADLEEARLGGANLERAWLMGAKLEGARLTEANLQGADLRKADLRRADLRRANLKRANLWGANLEGAILFGANLMVAAYSDDTKWPKDFEPEKAGAEKLEFSLVIE
jgi:uncharacterized protein YjbI with pentapeptide repeats